MNPNINQLLNQQLKQFSADQKDEMLQRLAFIGLRTLQLSQKDPVDHEDILNSSNKLAAEIGESGLLRKELCSIKEQLSKLTNRFEILSSEKKNDSNILLQERKNEIPNKKQESFFEKKQDVQADPKDSSYSIKQTPKSSAIPPKGSSSKREGRARPPQLIDPSSTSSSKPVYDQNKKPSSAWRTGDRSSSLNLSLSGADEQKRSNSEESPIESRKRKRSSDQDVAVKVTQMSPFEMRKDGVTPITSTRHHLDDTNIKDIFCRMTLIHQQHKDLQGYKNQRRVRDDISNYSQSTTTPTNSLLPIQQQLVQQFQQLQQQLQENLMLMPQNQKNMRLQEKEQDTLGSQDFVSLSSPQQFILSNNNNINNTHFQSPQFKEAASIQSAGSQTVIDKKNNGLPPVPPSSFSNGGLSSGGYGASTPATNTTSVSTLNNSGKHNNTSNSNSSINNSNAKKQKGDFQNKKGTTKLQKQREELSNQKIEKINCKKAKEVCASSAQNQPTYLKNVTSKIRQEIQNAKEASKRKTVNHDVVFCVKDVKGEKKVTHQLTAQQLEQEEELKKRELRRQEAEINMLKKEIQEQELRSFDDRDQRQYPQSRQFINSRVQYPFYPEDSEQPAEQQEEFPPFNHLPPWSSQIHQNPQYMKHRKGEECHSSEHNINYCSEEGYANRSEEQMEIPPVPNIEDDSYAECCPPEQYFGWNPSDEFHNEMDNETLRQEQRQSQQQLQLQQLQSQQHQQQQLQQQQQSQQQQIISQYGQFGDENYNNINFPSSSCNLGRGEKSLGNNDYRFQEQSSFYSSNHNNQSQIDGQSLGDCSLQQKQLHQQSQIHNLSTQSQNILTIANNFLQSPFMNQLSQTKLPKDISSRIKGNPDKFNESYLNSSSIHHSRRSYQPNQDQSTNSIVQDNNEKQNSSLSSSFAPFEPDHDMKVLLQKDGFFQKIFEGDGLSERKFDSIFASNSNINNPNFGQQLTSAKSFSKQIPDFITNAYSNSGSQNDKEDSFNIGDSKYNLSMTNNQRHIDGDGGLMEGRLSKFFANQK